MGRCLAAARGPGTRRRLKLLPVNTHLEPGPRSQGWGGSFLRSERGAKQCCVSFPGIFSSRFSLSLRSQRYYSKVKN